jgi:hypothetical protein
MSFPSLLKGIYSLDFFDFFQHKLLVGPDDYCVTWDSVAGAGWLLNMVSLFQVL